MVRAGSGAPAGVPLVALALRGRAAGRFVPLLVAGSAGRAARASSEAWVGLGSPNGWPWLVSCVGRWLVS